MAVDLLHLTDTHLRGPEPARTPPEDFSDAVAMLTGRSTDDLAAAVVDAAVQAHGRRFDVVLHTGDVVDLPTPAGYDRARQLLADAGGHVMVTPGNHDDPTGFRRLIDGDQPPTISHDIGAWRIVLIDSADPPASAGRYDLDALDALDDALRTDRPVLIGMHHPPISPCSDPECCTSNAWLLLEVIDRHPNVAAVLAGHLHVVDAVTRNGVPYYVSPSTALQLRHHHPLPEHNAAATAVGARVVRLHDDGSHQTHIAWLDDFPPASE